MLGIKMQLDNGLTSYQQVSTEMGTNFYTNVDMNKQAREYAKQQRQELPPVENQPHGTQTPNKDESEEDNGQRK